MTACQCQNQPIKQSGFLRLIINLICHVYIYIYLFFFANIKYIKFFHFQSTCVKFSEPFKNNMLEVQNV